MNCFHGVLRRIASHEGINWITVEVSGVKLRLVALRLAEAFAPDAEVTLLFKETEVLLIVGGAERSSAENVLPCIVQEVREGSILSEVSLASICGPLVAVVSSESAKRLRLRAGDAVVALLTVFDISLAGSDE